jgi:hypothetical protein
MEFSMNFNRFSKKSWIDEESVGTTHARTMRRHIRRRQHVRATAFTSETYTRGQCVGISAGDTTRGQQMEGQRVVPSADGLKNVSKKHMMQPLNENRVFLFCVLKPTPFAS